MTPKAEIDVRSDGRRWPRALVFGALLAFLGLLAYGLLTEGAGTQIDESLAEGEAPLAPEFNLPVLELGEPAARLQRDLGDVIDDRELALAELQGVPFVLNFWASWCGPCREEAPVLQRGWERHGPNGVLYLGLNMQDLTDDARAFLAEFEITYPTIREPDKEIATAYGATGIPETYFVSARGRVVGHVIGVLSDAQLDAGVRAARAGEIVGALTGGAQKPQR